MARSLTLGEMLLQVAMRQMAVQEGKKVYPKIAEAAVELEIPKEVEAMLVNLERTYHIQESAIFKLILMDPWESPVEKLLGYRLPKKGMASYFAAYLRALHYFRDAEEFQVEMKDSFARTDAERKRSTEILEKWAQIFGCGIYDLPEVMMRYHFPESEVEDFRHTMGEFRELTERSKELRKKVDQARELSYGRYAQVALLEDMVRWPEHLSVRRVIFYLLQRLLGFASLSDFEKTRKETERFLRSPEGVRKIQLLSQRRT